MSGTNVSEVALIERNKVANPRSYIIDEKAQSAINHAQRTTPPERRLN
jgi:hypothetical protein